MKKALVVVDMQNDFVTGCLGSEAAQKIVPAIVEKIKEYHAAGYPVFFTRDTHFSETYLQSMEGIHLPVVHCVIDSDGWQIIPELQEVMLPTDTIINKPTFGSKQLALDCRASEAVSFEVCGVCTGICVISNVVLMKTYMPDAEIIVDSNAVACVSDESNQAALTTLKTLQVEVK